MTSVRYQDSFAKINILTSIYKKPTYLMINPCLMDITIHFNIKKWRCMHRLINEFNIVIRYKVWRVFPINEMVWFLICKHTTRLKMGVDQNHYCNLFWRITNALICTTKIGKGRLAFLFAYSIFLKKLHNRVCNTKYEDGSRHNTN